jgi:hypothetical protein
VTSPPAGSPVRAIYRDQLEASAARSRVRLWYHLLAAVPPLVRGRGSWPLGIEIPSSSFTVLDTVATALEAKRDTLTILTASSHARSVRCSPELTEARWISNLDELGGGPVSNWPRLSLWRAGMASDPV